MNRLLGGVALLAIALGSNPGEGKSRKSETLTKERCFEICIQITDCAGLPPGDSTLAEITICADDCFVESRDRARAPGWLCASRAKSCEALRACNPGGKS